MCSFVDVVIQATFPDTPRNVKANALSETEIEVTWDSPIRKGHGLYYEVRVAEVTEGIYLFIKMTFRLFFYTLRALWVISLKIAICLTIYASSMINKGLDYEQSLFFLGPSSKTPETRK